MMKSMLKYSRIRFLGFAVLSYGVIFLPVAQGQAVLSKSPPVIGSSRDAEPTPTPLPRGSIIRTSPRVSSDKGTTPSGGNAKWETDEEILARVPGIDPHGRLCLDQLLELRAKEGRNNAMIYYALLTALVPEQRFVSSWVSRWLDRNRPRHWSEKWWRALEV